MAAGVIAQAILAGCVSIGLLAPPALAQERSPLEIAPLEIAPLEQGPLEQGPLEQGPLEQGPLEQGLAGAFKGCGEWVLNPASWASGSQPFVDSLALGPMLQLMLEAEEAHQPPPQLRGSNHYWRINAAPAAGYMLVVSDRLPMCHITGGGDVDLYPAITAVLENDAFTHNWERFEQSAEDGTISSVYRNRLEPDFLMVVSHAAQAGEWLGRVQIIATAFFDTME